MAHYKGQDGDQIYGKGDLVKYYEYEEFHYGEGTMRGVGIGVVLRHELVSWNAEAQEWIDIAKDDPYVINQYRVYCTQSGRTRLFGARSLELIARAHNFKSQKPNQGE